MSDSRAFSDLVSALIRLRQSLDDVTLPLEINGAEHARSLRRTMVDQLEDYVLPRLLQIDAPLLAVVGGSTGAGKSTLINSLVGAEVSPSGVLRPTTRGPVLVHHPDDAFWFQTDQILPDLLRSSSSTAPGDALQVISTPGIPVGLALVDAPDVDSVDRANRDLAAELLAAADLWIFVTSAARYADQVPWQVLGDAARRSTAVAVVLDRTAPDSITEVGGHLARMLTARGLRDSPLFAVPEGELDDGLLPAAAVAPVREWLLEVAADPSVRGGIVERSLLGTLRSLVHTAHQVADAATAQVGGTDRLRADVDADYTEVGDAVRTEVETGGWLRGPVVSRWQELVADGEPERWASDRPTTMRERLSAVVRSRARTAVRLEEAVADAVSAALVDAATRAGQLVADRWRDGSSSMLAVDGDPVARARATRELRAGATEQAARWQATAVAVVRTALAAAEPDDDRVSGVAVVLQVAALGRGVETGPVQAGVAAPTRTDAVDQALTMLGRAVDSDPTGMVERLLADLVAGIAAMLATEREARLRAVDELGTSTGQVERIRAAARTVDDMRPSVGQ